MKRLLFISFILIRSFCYSQEAVLQLKQIEGKMQEVSKTSLVSEKEVDRFKYNAEFIKLWEEALALPESMDYPFDSIKSVSKLKSNDRTVKVITWNIYRDDGTYACFGFVQKRGAVSKGLFQKKIVQNNYHLSKLVDKSNTIKKPEFHTGDENKWLGMTYTEIVDCDGYYLLIGWAINDKLIKRKYIDVLSFKPNGSPIFGKDVFISNKKRFSNRIVFEYSTEVSMLLKYDNNKHRIIFSYLAPREYGKDVFEGQHQYYGPDGSFDAYELKKKKWVLREAIDVRNEKSELDNAPKPDLNKRKKLYVPKR